MLQPLVANLYKSACLVTAPMRRICSVSSLLNQTIDKSVASKVILRAKQQSNLTFKDLAQKLNVNKVWLVSAIQGQHPIEPQVAKNLIDELKITGSQEEVDCLLQALVSMPENRGRKRDPTDPVLTRLNEMLHVYGDSIKDIIREEAGDGIMSAIDCTITCEPVIGKDQEVRIMLTINGKYLPYKANN